jgi:hypothetical protein
VHWFWPSQPRCCRFSFLAAKCPTSIWANYSNSLTWNKAIWGWFPLLAMISSEGEQWGRYNLPRYIYNLIGDNPWNSMLLGYNPWFMGI